MERVILHCDMNSFYASVEALYHPELAGKPLAVGGNPEKRHGIILAKNQPAKIAGVKTGETLAQAINKCPGLVVLKPDYGKYLRFSRLARKIYNRYSDQVESFGLDEAWIDVTNSDKQFGKGFEIAKAISNAVYEELGVTLSIGVSWNKIFAKFGSDYKKPNAITEINKKNYQQIIWRQEAGDLLYVGRSTQCKLNKHGIFTIGDLALANRDFLKFTLGKMGLVLWDFANGLDQSPVKPFDETYNGNERVIKSIGNSVTTARDLENRRDVNLIVCLLAESVAMRLRETGCFSQTVAIHVRDTSLKSISRQQKLQKPTDLTREIYQAAMAIFDANYVFGPAIRSIGVRVEKLLPNTIPVQLDLFNHEKDRLKQGQLDQAVDDLRRRFGNHSVRRAITIDDPLGALDAKKDHVIHPIGYF
ncbi:MAG: polymerase [Eubacteriaceae bacterium]|jgi:DNA polymerase-4|nr:polymerase [Eubacteriaceae bacterium]MDK2905113.1 polymerase [Eubacteriaceae bacterium]MDK2936211.1 polymerase [Eubacteriaceae bacterium]MDN5307720.1 polymerase [Eubacteriaceae bacterium]